ncbi:MAG: hypothetical protein ACUVQX_00210 [Candidatus Bathycorpusculaceae bacterium]
MNREEFSWKMMLIALALIIVGILLMFQSSSMLFEVNPLSIVIMVLAALFIFSGIILIVMATAAMASI